VGVGDDPESALEHLAFVKSQADWHSDTRFDPTTRSNRGHQIDKPGRAGVVCGETSFADSVWLCIAVR
jgi:hypothetical protein